MYLLIDKYGRKLYLQREREVAVLVVRKPVSTSRTRQLTAEERLLDALLLALLFIPMLVLFLVFGEDKEAPTENEEAPTCTGRGLIGPGF
jgi:hypothetical protein